MTATAIATAVTAAIATAVTAAVTAAVAAAARRLAAVGAIGIRSTELFAFYNPAGLLDFLHFAHYFASFLNAASIAAFMRFAAACWATAMAYRKTHVGDQKADRQG